MESDRGAAESIFAEWVRRKESGEAEELVVLLDAHPSEREELRDLHRAWEILSRARGEALSPTVSTFLQAPASDRLGHYHKIELLGRGGQGEVWLAEDTRLRRRVALKVLRAVEPDRLRRFEREAAVTSRLDHPAICPVYEWGEANGVAYIAMRYVEGQSLALSIAEAAPRRTERGPSSGQSSSGPSKVPEIARFARIVAGAARALQAAHEAGVIHRDVKPGNIIVTKDDQPVVVDFGFAEDTEGDWSALTRSREFLGTPAYMSPEQLLGKKHSTLDARTDVWSLGVTLYECLTGTRPFAGPTWQAIFRSITADPVPPARTINPALPLDLEVILATALEKDRERRYSSAGALADDLEAWLAGRPIAARPVSALGKLARWTRREPALAALACALTVLLPLLGGFAAYAVFTRKDVLAAEAADHERRLEELLLEGYSRFADSDWAGAVAAFEEVLRSEPASIEAAFGAFVATYQLDTPAGLAFLRDRFPPVDADSFTGRIRTQFLVAGLLPESHAAWMEALPAPRGAGEHFFAAWLWLDLQRNASTWTEAERARQVGGPLEMNRLLERAREHLSCALLLSRSPRLLHISAYAFVLSRLNAPASELLAIQEVVTTQWPDSSDGAIAVADALRTVAPERALEILEAARLNHPKHARVHASLGVVAGILGDDVGAEAAFRQAIALDPLDALSHKNLGVALLARDDLEGAIAASREALRLRPGSADARHTLAVGLYRTGDFSAARDASRRALELSPVRADILRQLARCLVRLGDLEGAREHARRTRDSGFPPGDSDPATAELVAELDALAEDSRRLDEWLGQGLFEPGSEERATLAWSAFRLGRHEEAAGLFADLFAEHPDRAEFHRVPAASAAAWASTTSGADEGRAWRERALAWLEEELAAITREREAGDLAPERLREQLVPWRRDPDLAPLREKRWRAGLDADEQRRSETLWGAVDSLLAVR